MRSSRLRAVAKQSLAWLGSRPWSRALGMALVHRLNRRTFARLRATPGVHQVLVRGSFARGDFVPLASDVDLALVLSPAGQRFFEQILALHRSLRQVRRRNPSVRDWWHHLILTSELPVVETFSDLYAAHEWRDENGQPTAPRSDWIDAGLRAAAAWSQLCLWSGSAFHGFLHPHERVHDFEAGVRKTLRFADRLGVRVALPSRPGAGRREVLVAVFRAIEQSAERVLVGAAAAGENAGASRSPSAPPPGILRTERACFVLLAGGLGDAELSDRFADLARRELPAAAVTYVLPAPAIAIWPFPAEPVLSGAPPPAMPLPLAREIHLFEALFLPSALRLALSFADANARLGRVVAALERALHLYGDGAPPGPPLGSDTRALFDHGSALCASLQEALLAFAAARKAGGKAPA
ncbi:MAG: nucleotidyltransferase domain-containing protein [Planctomycetes bacterium]|nr:nucleotidyltransferase domain-containing protein [Planctomycetota bacterium]